MGLVTAVTLTLPRSISTSVDSSVQRGPGQTLAATIPSDIRCLCLTARPGTPLDRDQRWPRPRWITGYALTTAHMHGAAGWVRS